MTTEAIQAALLDPQIKAALEKFSAAGVNSTLDTNRGTIVADLTNLRTKIIALATALDTLAAKLNADATVTDTNYATNNVATNSPAALTTSA